MVTYLPVFVPGRHGFPVHTGVFPKIVPVIHKSGYFGGVEDFWLFAFSTSERCWYLPATRFYLRGMEKLTDHDPHALMVLMGPEGDGPALYVWREEVPPVDLQPGDVVPLPDAAVEAAGDEYEVAALVEGCHPPANPPLAVAGMLPAPAAPGCRVVVVTRALLPEVAEDGTVLLGDFDPPDARRLLRLLEEHEVPFEIEADHSALMQPGRAVSLYLGMGPTGSRMNVHVPVEHLPHSRKLLRYLFPPEVPPAGLRGGPPLPPPAAPLEVYTAPATDVSVNRHRTFYAGPESGQPPDRPAGE